MVKKTYIPERGDVVWVDFSLAKGHEQSSRRPALVVSPKIYNGRSGLALVCPITSRAKGYPFEVLITTSSIRGVVLVDQIRSIDWVARRAECADKINNQTLKDVRIRLLRLME